ncbi:sugar ABC transporter permease [Streptacidiphilus sp. N1-10]|uniref:Sugar ABC transporter permease n=1 Tax=Streptacidiphilus jeojiensis TaxID=3229225 RepID=A0ABV6XRY1_9ACTN
MTLPTTALLAAGVTVGVPVALFGYLWTVEKALTPFSERTRRRFRPWAWLAPALILIGVFLFYPMLNTVLLSFRDADSGRWAGLANFRYLLDDGEAHSALRNSLMWVVLLTAGCLLFGLAIALLADRVRYEVGVKSIVVMPTAVSFVAGAVIWKFMFDYQPAGFAQTGTLNAAWTTVSRQPPVAWLVDTSTNNSALITVGIWMTTGFATVIISAALKMVPAELTEAARIDGANSWQLLRHVLLPQLRPTLTVVATLLAISAFKAFDVVYVMTNGNYHTDVIANLLYQQLFINQDFGRASAVAVLLTAVISPILAINVRTLRREGRE